MLFFCGGGHNLFVLRTSPKSQRRDQNGHHHDHFQKFQSKSPPFAASCSGLFRQGTQGEAMLFLSFLSPVADGFICGSRLSLRLW